VARPETWRRNLYAVFLAELLAITGFDVVLGFLPYYVQVLGVTAPEQVKPWSGWVYSLPAIAMGLTAPLWGALADRFGHKLMLQRAIFAGSVLLGIMGFVTGPRQLLAFRTVQGALTGTVAAAYAFVAATTPAQHRGFALGMLQVGVYLGASAGPLLGGLLIDTWGFRPAYLTSAAFLGAGAWVVTLLAHDGGTHSAAKRGTPVLKGMRLAIRSPGVLAVFGTRFLVAVAARTVGPMLPLLVQALATGQTRVASLAGLLESVSMACIALASMASGRYGERIGYRRVLTVSVAVAAVSILLTGLAQGPTPLLLLRAVDGLAMGGILVALNTTLASAAPEGRQGAALGLQSSVEAAAEAVGPALGAALAVALGLRAPFFAAAAALGLAIAFLRWT